MTGPEHPQRAGDDSVAKGRLGAAPDAVFGLVLLPHAVQPAVDCRQHARRVEVGAGVKLGRQPDFDVADALGQVVGAEFVCGPLQGLGGAQRRSGVGERPQVVLQVVVGLLEHEFQETFGRLRWQFEPGFARQLDQGVEAKRPVEVDVKVRLRQLPDQVGRGDGFVRVGMMRSLHSAVYRHLVDWRLRSGARR